MGSKKTKFRFIHLNNSIWKYKIFYSKIIIFSPKKEKYVVTMSKFSGWSNTELIEGVIKKVLK